MATDSCPSCPIIGDIDLSNQAWDDVTGNEGPSRYEGSWEFVECPQNFLAGDTKLYIKGGSSMWWFAIQPVNFKHAIFNMQIKRAVNIFSPLNEKINIIL